MSKENPKEEAPKKGEEEAKAKPQEEGKPGQENPKKELVGIVRVMETDLPGNRSVGNAIRLIQGVSFTMGNAIAGLCPFADKMVGEISEGEIKQLEEMVQNPGKHDVPSWAFNRRKDMETGQDLHLLASKLEITQKMDIDKLKKIRCYRGVRHMAGLPVRGQRTRSSFRKSGKAVGVSREKAARTKQKKEAEKK